MGCGIEYFQDLLEELRTRKFAFEITCPLNMNIFLFSNRSVSTADAPNWDQLGSSLKKFSFITDNIGNLIGSPGRRPSMPAPSMESESIQRKG